MAHVLRLIALLSVALFASLAFAAQDCTEWRAEVGGSYGDWSQEKGGALSSAVGARNGVLASQWACPPVPGKNGGTFTIEVVDPEAGTYRGRMTNCDCVQQPDGSCSYSTSYVSYTGISAATFQSRAAECAPEFRCDWWAINSGVAGNWNFGNAPVTLQGKHDSGPRCMGAEGAPPGGGCTMDFEMDAAFQSGGSWTTEGRFFAPANGSQACTTSAEDPKQEDAKEPAKDCGPGQVSATGSVNGTDVTYCATPDKVQSDDDVKKEIQTSNDGTSKTTESKKITECVGLVCTTTTSTTTTVADGQGGTSTSSTTSTVQQSKQAFCESRPNDAQCSTGDSATGEGGGGGEGSGSSFGGACASGFSCDGDAIQCAIAKEQHLKNCAFWDGPSSERDLYDAEKVKSGSVTGDLPGNSDVSVGPGSFDTSDAFGGGGSCIADKTVLIAGASVTLPFSTVCPYLAVLGNVLLVVSFLLAARIVTRG